MENPVKTIDDPRHLAEANSVPVGSPELPSSIGRYRVRQVLGKGGFGIVYLAHDEQLQRLVAIKVPRRELVSRPEDAQTYLAEARTLAKLDHPNIVPVHDVGGSGDFPCFIVSKLIEGSTLEQRLKDNPPDWAEAAAIIATVAEALHYAHRQRLVHRDIKPGNILLDTTGRPFVVDFGLALKEENLGRGVRFAGTPLYMSPEQVRGEGHRVDGRSDIFSLGVVFYEVLTGRLPFKGAELNELLDQISTLEPCPPRQIDDRIPKELERICLKVLAKRATERYTTAKDLADDLRHFLNDPSEQRPPAKPKLDNGPPSSAPIGTNETRPPTTTPAADSRPIKIVPKGLRSFDARDADFFLELLPGLRDRDGLPEGLRFWKGRIEEADPDHAFSVGLIYGPSGCGKSSLVKAGLLPRLSDDVMAVYVEATAADTETRLLNGLRKRCPGLPADLGLKETMAELRRGQGMPAGKKVLIVLDQFEQWLHAKKEETNTELVQALRQCDGQRAQCIVMVRDDFWMAATRFMRELEVRLVEAQNSAAVDLFPMRHAEKVLAAFGRAFGAIPEAAPARPSDAAMQALVSRLGRVSEQYGELREGVQKAIQVAEIDPEIALTRSRKVLEFVVRDVFERRIGEPPGTRPLENLLQRLVKDGHFPPVLDANATFVRMLGNVGTHHFQQKIAAAQVHQSLTQLAPILDWYFDVERPEALAKQPVQPQLLRAEATSAAAGAEQQEFIRQAVAGLAQEGKVISVRLSLFAEMMKGKTWTPATLQEVGGAEGVGVAFLEETFGAVKARHHQKAARAVLKALLPESGTDIKGHMRSFAELLEASGYAGRPRDFDDLVHMLDSDIRLITPTDPEGREDSSGPSLPAGEKYYQLTHDYLVPSLREWLTRKQKETRRGRAELVLADRAAVWHARPENRQLPSLVQALSIRLLTAKKNWTAPQQKMMRRCLKCQALRGAVLAVVLGAGAVTGLAIRDRVIQQQKTTREQAEEKRNATHAAGLVQAVINADTSQAPVIIEQMAPYRKWVDPLLREQYDQATVNSRQKLHASLALLPVDAAQIDYLYVRLLDAAPHEAPVLRDALAPHKEALLDKLWAVVEKPEKGKERQRLCAASALAAYDPGNERWGQAGALVVNDLVLENPVFLGLWSEAFRPVKRSLQPQLSEIFRERRPERTAERSVATNLLADYAADDAQVLADLLMDADDKQFAVIFSKFKERGERGLPVLNDEIDKKLPPELPSSDEVREKLAKRQANAAAALLKIKQQERVWPLLHFKPDPLVQKGSDPRVRSYLIHRLAPLGGDAVAGAIVKRLQEEDDITIRRALLLSLGEFGDKDFTPAERTALLPQLQTLYRTAANPGLHAAVEWLLRTWKQEKWLKQVNEEWVKDKDQQEKRLDGINELLAKEKEKAPPQWFVNGQGQTMVVIPGPVEFWRGSPLTEAGRYDYELQHKRRIGRTFALAAKSVTWAEYLQFAPGDKDEREDRYSPSLDCPVNYISWFMAARDCNWLSKQEGIDEEQWCYEIKGTKDVKLKEKHLSLTGYRLPTEAETEYATRAGAVTSRYYGETDELLPKYAWYQKNSQEKTWPVGRLKPNDLGFFDIQGNVFTWCQESYTAYPSIKGYESSPDREDADLVVVGTRGRVLRGGSFDNQAPLVRSAGRFYNLPSSRYSYGGFRPARTLTP